MSSSQFYNWSSWQKIFMLYHSIRGWYMLIIIHKTISFDPMIEYFRWGDTYFTLSLVPLHPKASYPYDLIGLFRIFGYLNHPYRHQFIIMDPTKARYTRNVVISGKSAHNIDETHMLLRLFHPIWVAYDILSKHNKTYVTSAWEIWCFKGMLVFPIYHSLTFYICTWESSNSAQK